MTKQAIQVFKNPWLWIFLKQLNKQVEWNGKMQWMPHESLEMSEIQGLRDFENLVHTVKYAEWIQNKTLADSQLPT